MIRSALALALAPLALGLLLATFSGEPVSAALNQAQLAGVKAAPQPGATLPLGAVVAGRDGETRPLGQWLGPRPALLVLADTRCTQLCGPILSIAAHALRGSGLRPGVDYDLVVFGFNPAARASDGEAMRAAELGADSDLGRNALFLSGPPATVEAVEKALDYTAVYDKAADRFAHPAEVFALTSGGRVSRMLGGLSLEAETVRLALVEAGQGRIGTFADRLHILCYGLDPAIGTHTATIVMALRVGAALTLAGLGLAFVALRRRPAVGTRA